jgi:hypothetical protein
MKIRDVPQTGSLGEAVSYKNRYGLVRRRKITPRDPRVPVQVDRRSDFQRARTFWGTLSDEQMLAWDAVARRRRTRAVLGQSGSLSGYLLSVHINVHLAMLGRPMTANPTPAPAFPANPILRLVASNAGGAVSLWLQVAATPVHDVLVFGARPKSPGAWYADDYAFLGVLPAPVDGMVDITDLFVAKYPAPLLGKRIFIQTLQQIEGWQDRPKTFSTRVQPA